MRQNRGGAITVVCALALAVAAGVAGLSSVRQVRAQTPGVAAAPRPVQTRASGAIVGSISPDGRLFVFADWSTPGDVAVQNLESGEYRRLTHTGTYSAQVSSISRDGTQVAYQWRNDDRVYDLRLMGIDGSNARVLLSNKDTNIYPSDWSPDDRQVLALLAGNDGSNRIALIAVADGTVRVLQALDSREPRGLVFSPDGRFIVYDLPARQDHPGRDMFLLSSDGTGAIPLVQGAADDAVLGWTLDGAGVIFSRARAGTMDAWAIPVAGGRPHGPPVLIRRDMGQIRPLGFSRAGAFYYVRDKGTRNVYVTPLDPATGSLVLPPKPVNDRSDDPTFGPAWSPDGKYLAYFSTPGANDIGPGARTIVVRSAETDAERVLYPKLDYPIDHPYELRWSPDSRSLVTIANDKRRRWSLYLVDVQTGNARVLVQGRPGERLRWPAWSPDGRVLFYAHQDPVTNLSRILARNLRSGHVSQIYRAPLSALTLGRGNSVAISPDGRHLAFSLDDPATRSQALMILPTAAGEAREILRAPSAGVMAWTAETRVLFRGTAGDPPRAGVWSIAPDGGNPRWVGDAGGLFGLSVHPNGREIAFTAGGIMQSEVWMMESFLASPEAAK